jgi:hypothetical protein
MHERSRARRAGLLAAMLLLTACGSSTTTSTPTATSIRTPIPGIEEPIWLGDSRVLIVSASYDISGSSEGEYVWLRVEGRVVGGPPDISEFAQVAYVEASDGLTDRCHGGAWGPDMPTPVWDFVVRKTDRALTLHFGLMGPAVPLDSLMPASVPTPTPPAVSQDRLDAAVRLIEALGGQVSVQDQWTSEEFEDGGTFARYGQLVTNSFEDGTYATNGRWTVAWNGDGILIDLFNRTAANASPAPAGKLTTAQAKARVLQDRDILGVTMGAPDEVTYEDSFPGWLAVWNRTIDGIPTLSGAAPDGVQLVLNPDGSFREYTYQWSPAGDKPATTITKAQALAAAGEMCAEGECSATLIWERSSGSEPLRLIWEVHVTAAPCASVSLDAGTGEVIDETGCI